jgi:membrane protease YdiL (CAAX protease family)
MSTSGPQPLAASLAVASASSASSASPARALSLRWIIGTVVTSMIAWELTRAAWLALFGDPSTGGALVALSAVRALALLAAPVWVTRRVWLEPPRVAFQLGRPAGRGVLRALAYGALYLGVLQGIDLLSQASGAPSWPGAFALAQQIFDCGIEEALFRGFALTALRVERRFALANLIGAGLFCLAHTRLFAGLWALGLHVELVPPIVSLFCLALTLGAATRAAACIWIALLIHVLNNALSS